jgi:hypothetical protein
MGDPTTGTDDAPRSARVARLFASPTVVLIIIPALVVAVGIVVLLLGRRATHDSTGSA